MKLTLGFSPCPNDTFIFDALVNGLIDTGDLEFDLVMEDVQTLNELAIAGKIDVTKISYGTLPLVLEHYGLLRSGGALGMGTGPLLIAKFPLPGPAVNQARVAIPGKHTTAHVLFALNFPDAHNKVFMPYNAVEDFVLNSAADLEDVRKVQLGVIIHENRFTYERKGLVKISDLGAHWESTTGLPIPLGGIVMRRSLGDTLAARLNTLIAESARYAFARLPVLSDFFRDHAQEMEEEVMRSHIELYVNDFSLDVGVEGEEAVQEFLRIHSALNKIPLGDQPVFMVSKADA